MTPAGWVGSRVVMVTIETVEQNEFKPGQNLR